MKLEAPWTTARRLFSQETAIRNAARPLAERERAELETEVLAIHIRDKIDAFNERHQHVNK